MEVQLYVYDLSRGMARQMSRGFLGIQIDAIYHTSIVLGGIEYFFGLGVQTCYAGRTHHGAPMEKIFLGPTSLPMDVILEYLESLKTIYTAESYDLFLHNCNNFSNDFAMFLVGRVIPAHITSLPQTVLNTPFGQMMRPYIDQSMRTVTQAPVASPRAISQPNGRATPSTTPNGTSSAAGLLSNGHSAAASNGTPTGVVHNVTSMRELDTLLSAASKACALIFFTSSTCGPCKAIYPLYDELAAESGGKATFIKVDINYARDIAAKYSIRATPTFVTFLKGRKEHEWLGANPRELRGNVRLLIQTAFPPHPHTALKLPTLLQRSLKPVTYAKAPPLEKLIAKMGDAGKEPAVLAVKEFIRARENAGAKEAPLPDLRGFSEFLDRAIKIAPEETLFAIFDLLRAALVDPRVSGFFAERSATIRAMITYVNERPECPYNLRIVTLHLACNLFTSTVFTHFMLSDSSLSNALTALTAGSLLDTAHQNVRVAASSLAFNLAVSNHRSRMEENRDALPEETQVELAASVLQTLSTERESKEACEGLMLALGFLLYCAPEGGALVDVCRAMDATETVAKNPLIEKRVKEEMSKMVAAFA